MNYPYHVFGRGKIILFYMSQILHFFALDLLCPLILKREGPSGLHIVMEILKFVIFKDMVKNLEKTCIRIPHFLLLCHAYLLCQQQQAEKTLDYPHCKQSLRFLG